MNTPMLKIKYIIAASLLVLSTAAVAQNLESGYFIENYLYRHDLNPAFGNEQSYVAIPLLGNANIATEGNVGLKTFLYNVNGRTATFLHPGVSMDEFLGNIKDENKFSETVRLQLLGAGFKALGGYNTVEVNIREQAGIVAPGSLFRAMKEGLKNTTYDFGNIDSKGNAYAEIAFGHSRKVNDQLRLGAKVKVLIGLASETMKVTRGQLVLGEDGYTANVNAELSVSASDVAYSHKVNENTNHKYVNGIDKAKMGVAGFGLAADLGAEYRLNDALSFSASLLDLGFISYSNSYVASTKGDKSFNTDKYIFNADDEAENSFENEFKRMKNDLSALYELDDMGDKGGVSRTLAATVNVGAKYTLPAYDKLNFGLLLSSRFNGKYSATNARLSANITPVKSFSAGVNISAGTYGVGMGWILNYNTKGFGLFVGMDRLLGSVAKQLVPLNANSNLALGVNIPL